MLKNSSSKTASFKNNIIQKRHHSKTACFKNSIITNHLFLMNAMNFIRMIYKNCNMLFIIQVCISVIISFRRFLYGR